MKKYMLLIGPAALLLAACGAESTAPPSPPPPGRALALQVVAGAGQTAMVATEFPTPIVVQVVDTGVGAFSTQSIPVPGQIINFVVTSGGGTVFAGTALTDSLGQAREVWTAGPVAGEQCLEARAVDPETGAKIVFSSVCATATPGAAEDISLASITPVANVGDTVDVRDFIGLVRDGYGNIISNPVIQTELYDGNSVDEWGGPRVIMPSPGMWMVRIWVDSAHAQLTIHVP